MARIAIAGWLHETNTFAQRHTDFDAFVGADAWPGLVLGDALLEVVAGVNLASAGFVEQARAQGHSLLPLLWASANPSGLVTQHAYEKMWSLLAQELDKAGPIDALFLDLHGAMVAEHVDDGEGELLARLRGLLGPRVAIVAALDFHANISPRMVALTDALTVYRTYPHVDMAASGARAALLLQRLLDGERLHKAYRQLPFLIPMLSQCTLIEPCAGLMRLVAEQEQEQEQVRGKPGGISAAIAPGFPLADTYDCGPSVLAYGPDPVATEAVAQRLADAVMAQRAAFGSRLYRPQAAVTHALAVDGDGPIILADTQDNPGGGAGGDTTDILHELLRQDATDACLGLLCDPGAAAATHAAGLGATIELALGGQGGIGAAARALPCRGARRRPVHRHRSVLPRLSHGAGTDGAPEPGRNPDPGIESQAAGGRSGDVPPLGHRTAPAAHPGTEKLGAFPGRFRADRTRDFDRRGVRREHRRSRCAALLQAAPGRRDRSFMRSADFTLKRP